MLFIEKSIWVPIANVFVNNKSNFYENKHSTQNIKNKNAYFLVRNEMYRFVARIDNLGKSCTCNLVIKKLWPL